MASLGRKERKEGGRKLVVNIYDLVMPMYVVSEKTLDSPLDSREIKKVNPCLKEIYHKYSLERLMLKLKLPIPLPLDAKS